MLGQEDPLEKVTATHSSTLAWWIPRKEATGRLQYMGYPKIRFTNQTANMIPTHGCQIHASNLHVYRKIYVLSCSPPEPQFSSVQLSHSVVSNSLQPHGLQHARSPCPTPDSAVYTNSCSLSRWCHPTISSYVIPFSSHLQSFPVSGSFQRSQYFTSVGQSIGVSASAPILPMNIQGCFVLGWTDSISWSPRDS